MEGSFFGLEMKGEEVRDAFRHSFSEGGSKNGSVVMMVGDVEACVLLVEVASQRLFK